MSPTARPVKLVQKFIWPLKRTEQYREGQHCSKHKQVDHLQDKALTPRTLRPNDHREVQIQQLQTMQNACDTIEENKPFLKQCIRTHDLFLNQYFNIFPKSSLKILSWVHSNDYPVFHSAIQLNLSGIWNPRAHIQSSISHIICCSSN